MYNIWNIIIKKEMYIIQAMTGRWSWRLWTGCASRELFPKIPDQKLLYLELSLQNGKPGFWHAKDSKSMVDVPMW